MKWAGETMFVAIGPGTSLLLFENPYVEGEPPASLTTGDEVQIRLGGADQKMIRATVVDAEPTAATLNLADGTNWLITPRRVDELPTSITWKGGPSQEWVVRTQT
jgi:hypothetical protein